MVILNIVFKREPKKKYIFEVMYIFYLWHGQFSEENNFLQKWIHKFYACVQNFLIVKISRIVPTGSKILIYKCEQNLKFIIKQFEKQFYFFPKSM